MSSKPDQSGWHVRSAVAGDIAAVARVHVESWRTTYQGLLPAAFLRDLSVERREAMWRQQLDAIQSDQSIACLFVAVDEGSGRIIGFASAGPEREPESGYDAELYTLYLLEDHQRKGIGRHLLRQILTHLGTAGQESMRAWVLEGNPAAGFYERMGGQRCGRKTLDIAGETRTELAYGWKKIDATFDWINRTSARQGG